LEGHQIKEVSHGVAKDPGTLQQVPERPNTPLVNSDLSINKSPSSIEVSVVMPCLNEAATLGACIQKARAGLESNQVIAEIIVADNGSTDESPRIAEEMGARVVHVESRGYGAALMGGINAARGKFIIMGDADDTYDFNALGPFIDKLREGNDLVMGNRFKGGIQAGAMPKLHRYLGNPVLTGLGRLFFRSPCGDFHCGLRGFRKEAVMQMGLRTTGMEFASEMVVKATLHNLRIAEVPTTLAPDARSRAPHLRTWRDGWRHLRFLLLYSPRWLFLYPGAGLMAVGIAAGTWLEVGPVTIGNIRLDIHSLLYAAAAVVVGFQAIIFALFTKIFAITEGLLPEDPKLKKVFRYVTLEAGLALGIVILLLGVTGSILAVNDWGFRSFGNLDPQSEMRVAIPSVTALILGSQIVLSSFFLSVLGLNRKRN
jgi:glycosyltransferase involved in cell wall biosynthesis